MSTIVWITLAAAVATYLTRIGGYAILSRFDTIHPRVDAGLRAVPQAVLATLVVPPMLTNGWAEAAALLIAGMAALRVGLLPMFLIGWASLVVFRQIGF